jgi:hypothetical protein
MKRHRSAIAGDGVIQFYTCSKGGTTETVAATEADGHRWL